MNKKDRIADQMAEFDACGKLITAYQRCINTPVVDDDYPEMRHEYESALRSFLDAVKKNREDVAPSIIKPWAACLGLRHQGVLVSATRGCDSVTREDCSKYLVRVYRGVLLNAYCGDIRRASSFMVPFDDEEWQNSRADFLRSIDHYPNHWILHFMHACEIVGYKHDEAHMRDVFRELYEKLVRKFHLSPESEAELDRRLSQDEKEFAAAQVV